MSKIEDEKVTVDEWKDRDCRKCRYSEGIEASRYIFCSRKGARLPIGYVCGRYKEKEKENNF